MDTGEKPYFCDVCQKHFRQKRTHLKHTKIHGGDKTFYCEVCQKTFMDKFSLSQHASVHSSARPYSCDLCQKNFKRKSHVHDHMVVHTGARPYSCDACQRKFASKYNLKTHKIRTHTDKLYCAVCQRTFTSKQSLSEHWKSHPKTKSFSCYLCAKTFTRKCHLRVHLNNHSCEKHFSCDVCQKNFKSQKRLSWHMTAHSSVRPYSCDTCQKKFATSFILARHKRTHATVPLDSYATSKCKLSVEATEQRDCKLLSFDWYLEIFSIQPNLSNIKFFSCTLCKKTFTHREKLQDHMKSHTDGAAFSCDHCEKAFTITDPFVCIKQCTGAIISFCAICRETFEQQSTFQVHIKCHKSGQMLSCNVCRKTFRQEQEMFEHMKSHMIEQKVTLAVVGAPSSNNRQIQITKPLPKQNTCELMSFDLCVTISNQPNPSTESGKQFFCTLCKKTFPQKQDLQSHMKIHTSGTLLSCSKCSKTFALTSDIFVYIKKCTGSRVFYCVSCKRTYSNQSDLLAHIKSHTVGQDLSSGVNIDTVAQRQDLPEHMKSHTLGQDLSSGVGSAQGQYLPEHMKINTVGQDLSSVVSMDISAQGQDVPELVDSIENRQVLSSGVSTDSIAQRQGLPEQLLVSSSLGQTLSSHVNTITSTQRHELPKHVDSQKTHKQTLSSVVSMNTVLQRQDIPEVTDRSSLGQALSASARFKTLAKRLELPTGVCRKTFAQNQDLLGHMKNHTLEENLSCDMPKNAIPSKTILKHAKTHSPGTQVNVTVFKQIETEKQDCLKSHADVSRQVCDVFAISKPNPTEEMFTQAQGISRKEKKSCLECKKSFSIESDLLVHMKTHTSTKMFSCGICQKQFGSKDSMTSHMRRHELFPLSNKTVTLYGIKEPASPSEKHTWARSCCLCGTTSSTWFLVDHSTGILCDQCKLSSACCSLCNQKVMFSTLRTHIGYHTGELVCRT